MKFLKIKTLIFISLVIFLGACNSMLTSDKVEQRIIFPSYSAHYDASTQILTATVTFQRDNESGEYIKLSKKSSISFDGEDLKQMSDKDRTCYYFLEKKNVVTCPDNVQFNYTNDEGKLFANQLNIRTIQISDMSLNKNQDNTVKYNGPAIDEDETIVLMLSKDGQQFELQPDVADNNLLLVPSAMLQDFASGTYDAYFLRTTYSTSVKAMDRGGNAEISYHSKSYKITIQ